MTPAGSIGSGGALVEGGVGLITVIGSSREAVVWPGKAGTDVGGAAGAGTAALGVEGTMAGGAVGATLELSLVASGTGRKAVRGDNMNGRGAGVAGRFV